MVVPVVVEVAVVVEMVVMVEVVAMSIVVITVFLGTAPNMRIKLTVCH